MDQAKLLTLAAIIEGKEHGYSPGFFNMAAVWHVGTAFPTSDAPEKSYSCGSPACIAGWTFATFPEEDESMFRGAVHGMRKVLGLDAEQAFELFGAGIEPGKIHKITPAQAAECLRHLAKTGKVDWERAMKRKKGVDNTPESPHNAGHATTEKEAVMHD